MSASARSRTPPRAACESPFGSNGRPRRSLRRCPPSGIQRTGSPVDRPGSSRSWVAHSCTAPWLRGQIQSPAHEATLDQAAQNRFQIEFLERRKGACPLEVSRLLAHRSRDMRRDRVTQARVLASTRLEELWRILPGLGQERDSLRDENCTGFGGRLWLSGCPIVAPCRGHGARCRTMGLLHLGHLDLPFGTDPGLRSARPERRQARRLVIETGQPRALPESRAPLVCGRAKTPELKKPLRRFCAGKRTWKGLTSGGACFGPEPRAAPRSRRAAATLHPERSRPIV
jgi:hypothetical protein